MAATWVAATGAALVFVAAITVTVAHWWSFPDWVRASALLAYGLAAAAAAYVSRRRAPGVSIVLSHLAVLLAVPAGAAAAVAAHAGWPGALVAAGLTGVLAATLARRWVDAPLLADAMTAEVVIALAGTAGLLGIPLAVLVAAGACVALGLGRQRRASELAVVASLTPVLTALGAFGIGSGTAFQLGVAGDALVWAAPVAGVLSGGVLALVATRRSQPFSGVVALAAVTVGVGVGLGAFNPPASVWWSMPGLALIAAIGLAVVTATDRFWSRITEPLAVVAELLAFVAAAPTFGLLLLATAFDAPAVASVAVAFGLLAAGSVAGALRSRLASSPVLTTPLAIAAGIFAMTAARAATGNVLGVGFVTVVLAYFAARSSRPSRAALAWPAGLALWALGTGPPAGQPLAGPLIAMLFIAAAGGLAMVPLRLPAFRRAAPWAHLVISATVALALTTCCPWPKWDPVVAMVAAGAIVLAARRLQLVASPFEWLVMGIVAIGALDHSGTWPSAVVWLVGCGVVAVEAGVSRDHPLAHAAAVVVSAAAVLTAMAAGAPSTAIIAVLLVVAVAVTGIAISLGRTTPLDSLGLGAAVVAMIDSVATGAELFVSISLATAGLLFVLEGVLTNERVLRRAGEAATAVGLVSMPFTSGLVDAIQTATAPHGVTDGDLVVTALFLAGVVAGMIARRTRAGFSSWFAYGPPLALFGMQAVVTLTATGAPWRAAAGLIVGMATVVAGGWRRLSAPLVLGTVTIMAVVGVAAGPQLADLPVWVWLAVGGSALLAAASLIELSSRADHERPRHLAEAVLRRFE